MNTYRYSWELVGSTIELFEADKPECLGRFDSEVEALAFMTRRHPDARIDSSVLLNEGPVVEFPPFESERIV